MANKPVLSPQRLKFVLAFCIKPNATEAAIAAGYKEGSARQQGAYLLTIPVIRAEIARRTAPALAKQEITIERILLESARIAFADTRSVVRADGSFLPLNEWPADVAACIAGMEFDENGNLIKVRWWNKNEALERFFKYKRLYAEIPPVPPGNTNIVNFNIGRLDADEREQLRHILGRALPAPGGGDPPAT